MENRNTLVGKVNTLRLEGVTLSETGRDPVLEAVDFSLPLDETIVVESTRPQDAVYFLQLLAGRRQAQSGRLVLGGKSGAESVPEECRDLLGCFFETDLSFQVKDVLAFWGIVSGSDALRVINEHFDLQLALQQPMACWPFSSRKLAGLIKALLHGPEMVLLEDPASGLSEKQWMQYLDYLQYHQRRGGARHVYITNHAPLALRHLSHNKLFLEEGLIYFDAEAGYKKASHF
jgi:ABC-type multidrug transport system ATPase subunit